MRRIKEVLRLRYEAGLSHRAIGVSCRLGQATVQDYLLRARAAGLSWPLPEGMDEEELERRLFPQPRLDRRGLPDRDFAELCQVEQMTVTRDDCFRLSRHRAFQELVIPWVGRDLSDPLARGHGSMWALQIRWTTGLRSCI